MLIFVDEETVFACEFHEDCVARSWSILQMNWCKSRFGSKQLTWNWCLWLFVFWGPNWKRLGFSWLCAQLYSYHYSCLLKKFVELNAGWWNVVSAWNEFPSELLELDLWVLMSIFEGLFVFIFIKLNFQMSK